MSNCIVIEDLEMKFRGCDALRGIDLTIPQGAVFALLGENGAGKSTLIRILTGYQIPTRGSCRVLGLDPVRDSLEIRRRIGYVSDAPAFYEWMRVDEIGWFTSAFYGEGYLKRYRDSVEHYELPLQRKIKHLSKGQRAKVALALATSHDPELLILDEPTSGLDPLVRREFLESMVDRAVSGRTVLLSSHQISEVERVSDHVAILHNGKIGITESLAKLRQDTYEVTLTVNDPLAALPLIPEPARIMKEQKIGRQIQWIVHGFSDALEDTLTSWTGVQSVRTRPATLEEIFVACTRGGRSVLDAGEQSSRSDLELEHLHAPEASHR